MAQCQHDENVHKHALIALNNKNDNSEPTIIEAVCRCDGYGQRVHRDSTTVHYGDYSGVSFADDFVVVLSKWPLGRQKQQNRIRRIDGVLDCSQPSVFIGDIQAANRYAEYFTISDNEKLTIYRMNRQDDTRVACNHISGTFDQYGGHAVASLDDSTIILSGWRDEETKQSSLFDIATETVISSFVHEDRDCQPMHASARGRNTWVMQDRDGLRFSLYDDRMENWRIVTHNRKQRSYDEEGCLSSCIDDIVMVECVDCVDEDVPPIVCALDMRNGYWYELAKMCEHANPIHFQL